MRHPSDALSASDLIDARDCDVEPREPVTHWLHSRLHPRQRWGTAICGAINVRYERHDNEPTCEFCRARLAEDEGKTAEELFGTEGGH